MSPAAGSAPTASLTHLSSDVSTTTTASSTTATHSLPHPPSLSIMPTFPPTLSPSPLFLAVNSFFFSSCMRMRIYH
ncbi:hypothetical protein LINPERPRIM_LOCUS10328 [Linum perenne]